MDSKLIMGLAQPLGWVGVVALVLMYFLSAYHPEVNRRPVYWILNLAGAAGVAVAAIATSNWPTVALGVVWAAGSLLGLLRLVQLSRTVRYLTLGSGASALLAVALVGRPAEVDLLGWNLLTLSATGIIIFGVWGAKGLTDQIRKIWQDGRTDSVEVVWFLTFAGMFISLLLYAEETDRFAMAFQGWFRLAFTLPIIAGVFRFRGFSRKEWLVAVLVLTAVGANLVIAKDVAYVGFSIAGVASATIQLWKIFRNGKGRVSMELVRIYAASSAFWTIYGFAVDRIVFWVSLGYLSVYLGKIILVRHQEARTSLAKGGLEQPLP